VGRVDRHIKLGLTDRKEHGACNEDDEQNNNANDYRPSNERAVDPFPRCSIVRNHILVFSRPERLFAYPTVFKEISIRGSASRADRPVSKTTFD
jgi:hypothetical protein